MESIKLIIKSIYILLLLATCGCLSDTSRLTQAPLITTQPVSGSIIQPSNAYKVILTLTPSPTIPKPIVNTQPTEGKSLTYTSTHTPNASPIVFATLNPKEEETAIRKFLEENTTCELPCFGGITPGQTKLEEAIEILKQDGFPWLGTKYRAEGIVVGDTYWTEIYLSTPQLNLSTNISLLVPKGQDLVDGMLIGLGGADIAEVAPQYEVPRLVKILGIPSQVWISMGYITGQSGTPYEIRIYYDSLGIALHYIGSAQLDGDVLRICPSDPNKYTFGKDSLNYGVSLFLQGPAQLLPLEYLLLAWGDIKPDKTYSFQDATGLSVTDFYHMVIDDAQPKCFHSPKNMWAIR